MKTSRLFLLLTIALIPLMLFAGCSKKSSVPEDYGYDDLTEYIKLGEYKNIEYDKADLEVTDEEVKTYIDNAVSDTSTTTKKTSGTVKEDSIVNMDYSGSIDGVKFDGGTAEGQDLDIANSTYIAGFAEALIGHKVGENFDINVTFPEDYGNDELKGKDAVFNITINYLQEKTVPEYNDEWVSANTDYKTTDEYEESVRKELGDSKKKDSESSEKLEVFNAIVDGSEVIKYPEKEYQEKHDQLVNTYKTYAESSGADWESYLNEQMGMTSEQFESLAKESAESAVKQELVMHQIARLEDLGLSDDDYNDYLIKLLEDAGYTEKSYEEENNMTIQEYAEKNGLYSSYLYQKVMDKVMEYSIAK